MAAEFDQQPVDLKMVFLGDSAVGKTALLRRFNTGFPPEEDQPAPVDGQHASGWKEVSCSLFRSGTLGGRIRASSASFVPRHGHFSVML